MDNNQLIFKQLLKKSAGYDPKKDLGEAEEPPIAILALGGSPFSEKKVKQCLKAEGYCVIGVDSWDEPLAAIKAQANSYFNSLALVVTDENPESAFVKEINKLCPGLSIAILSQPENSSPRWIGYCPEGTDMTDVLACLEPALGRFSQDCQKRRMAGTSDGHVL